MLPGILRETCRLSLAEVGARLGLAPRCVQARVGVHRKFLVESEEYSERAAALVAESLQAFAGPIGQPVDDAEPGGLLWTPSSTLDLP